MKFTFEDYLTRSIWSISSLSENKIARLFSKNLHELIRHNE